MEVNGGGIWWRDLVTGGGVGGGNFLVEGFGGGVGGGICWRETVEGFGGGI